MVTKTSKEIEDKVLAMNGHFKQEEVAQQLGLSTTLVRRICNRRGITWKWQTRDQTGKKNHNFKNGMGRSTIERATRQIVIEAGKCLYTCERCGFFSCETERDRHHKDRNRANNTSDNIEVLCDSCHRIEHNKDAIRNLETGRYIK